MKAVTNITAKIKGLSKTKKIVISLITVGLVVFGWSTISAKDSDAPTYQFATIEKGDITKYVSETGQVTTSNKVDIVSTINGIVTDVFVENGQVVEKGDKLFYVQSSATDAERTKALADYNSAKASLEQAKASQYSLQSTMFSQWDEFKELSETDDYKDEGSVNRNLPEFHIPEKDWLASEANYKAQDQVIAKAQASVTNAWLEYQAMTSGPITATAPGTVANISFANGQQVSSSDSALIISSESENWVKVAISENDIVEVAPGQTAVLEIDALDGKEVTGTVQRVDEFATDVSDVMVYYVYLTMDEFPNGLRPGMTTQVDITTLEEKDVLLVPNIAIKPYQGEKAVQIMDEGTGTVIYKPIIVGISGDTHTQVISGLEEGDSIISSTATSESSEKSGSIFGGPPN